MSYTLATWALWMVAAALIGAVVGWLLRGLRRPAAPEVGVTDAAADDTATWAAPAGGDATAPAPTTAELEGLRAKVAELDGVVLERNRLQWELDELRAAAAARPATAAAPAAPAAAPASEVAAERDEWTAKAIAYEQVISEMRVRLWNSEARLADLQTALRSGAAPSAAAGSDAPPTPDLAAGALVLGPSLRLDDLTVVEGIGPKIADLCRGRGITTWWALANTSVDTLRELLDAAGPKFQVHDPSSWPEQARLLAMGQWVAFQTLTERLRGGRSSG